MKTLNNLLLIFAILTFVANAQYVVRYGLSSSAYQSEFNNWVGTQKMRLADVSGYNKNGQETYAAIFTSTPGPEWTARHHMDEASYQAAVTDLSNQGWRPNRISAFEVNGAPMFAAIFTKPQGAWVARHDLLPADYQAQFNSWTGQGYRLIEVCGYTKGGATRYAAVWEKSAGPGYYAFNGLTAAQYQTTFTDQAKNGFIPVRVSGYEVGGTDYYAAIFQQSNSGVYARHRLTEHDFSAEFNNGWYTGKTMIHLDGYTVGGSVRFAALWTGGSLSSKDASTIDNLVSTYMSNFHAPGVSIGVMKDERLVWAKGYGVEDKSTGALASTSSMFRIASVSKPITAIAIMKLTETHGLKLTDLLFGPTGLLGDICSQVSCMDKDDLNKITVQHCLEHSTGYDGNDAVWVQYQLNNADLIKWVAQNYLQLDHPGVQYMYNNYGYFLLARVIEKKTGMIYQDYVKKFILSPCGITDMYIGADSQNQKGPNEVTYYPDQNNGDPYALHLTRMDGNGGWVSHPVSLLKVVACVDKKSNRPDILSPSTIDVMRTHSTANGAGSYAKGWIVDGDQWTHNGCMSGTLAILKHYANGISVAITVNTRSANDGCDWNGVYPLADAISSGGISWSSSNLF